MEKSTEKENSSGQMAKDTKEIGLKEWCKVMENLFGLKEKNMWDSITRMSDKVMVSINGQMVGLIRDFGLMGWWREMEYWYCQISRE